MCHEQPESFLCHVLKRFSARNYYIAPCLSQPDFGWDHAGVPLAFSMTPTPFGLARRDQAVNSGDALAGAFLPARFWLSDVSPFA